MAINLSSEEITALINKTAQEKFGIKNVKPFQLLVMQRIIEQEKNLSSPVRSKWDKRDQIVILPTGTGKSLCFLLPASILKGITIIVYPLLALMNDQLSKLKKSGIQAVCLRGGQTKKVRENVFDALNSGTKILITNPETLNQPKILNRLKKYQFELMVVDEAHVIAMWGESFRPAYLKLKEALNALRPNQTLAFTATATEATVDKIKECLIIPEALTVRGDADRENIIYNAYPAYSKDEGVRQILSFCEKPAIVFCNSRVGTHLLCTRAIRESRALFDGSKNKAPAPMRYYHAGLTRTEREKIEDWFLHSADGVLFSTCAYGMGIDKPNIRTVIHSYLPENVEEYLQESGRAGRDGAPSKAYVITTKEDTGALADIFKGNSCRRTSLLKALGQDKDTCTGCDICNKKRINAPYGEALIKKFISRHHSYEPVRIARILTGCTCKHHISPKDRLSPYYSTLNYNEDDLAAAIIAEQASRKRKKKSKKT